MTNANETKRKGYSERRQTVRGDIEVEITDYDNGSTEIFFEAEETNFHGETIDGTWGIRLVGGEIDSFCFQPKYEEDFWGEDEDSELYAVEDAIKELFQRGAEMVENYRSRHAE